MGYAAEGTVEDVQRVIESSNARVALLDGDGLGESLMAIDDLRRSAAFTVDVTDQDQVDGAVAEVVGGSVDPTCW